ncbi:hypothetical protein CDAR_566481 [Caerostris darwini]|uniref:Uncharacterized protein n=1 Tax=Caerostris darwini TaxID=1538125 RepID=A0AAV4X3D1_9ARAC|nr:hypothetical protein CDAR_566481 [Caerostris darwini]
MYFFICVLIAIIALAESWSGPTPPTPKLSKEERTYRCLVYAACKTTVESEKQRIRACTEFIDEKGFDIVLGWYQGIENKYDKFIDAIEYEFCKADEEPSVGCESRNPLEICESFRNFSQCAADYYADLEVEGKCSEDSSMMA